MPVNVKYLTQFDLIYKAAVLGLPAVIFSSGGLEYHNTSTYGVDISDCSSISFTVKTCEDGYILLGDGSSTGSYEIALGGWDNTKSAIRECGGCEGEEEQTPQLMDCDSYTKLWLAWSAEKVSLGRGIVKGEDVLVSRDISTVHRVTTMSVSALVYNATYTFGAMHDVLYKLVGENVKFENGFLDETPTSLLDCGRLCKAHALCGMFSFNSANEACALFDRMASQLSQNPQPQWHSWVVKYC
ncbi:uncharacterized protein LOC124288757 isoform X3 [Haliotis rubra]|uniref:uncharacterized protein LOC124288757 isoform X3 n=1 Tax=Haliotis rubra TaxID=36100 RepID=UPI001EE5FC87|nr:uncharacterized protein LOC124288757 isoform X3 [Haliotis rubra]